LFAGSVLVVQQLMLFWHSSSQCPEVTGISVSLH